MKPDRQKLLHRHQAGMSNIQIMVGVLISAIMIVGSMGMIRAIDQAKVDNDLRDLADLKQKTVRLALQHGSLSDVTQESLIEMGFFPATDVSGPVGSRVISSRWKGAITARGNGVYTPGDAIAYSFDGVSTAGCKQLAMQAGSVADQIMVSGTFVKSTPAGDGTGTANEPLLIALCDAGKDNLHIDFFISKY